MNKEQFLQLIESDCNCNQDCLEIAVNRGFKRAVDDKVDIKKILTLAVAFVITFSMCFIVSIRPVKTAVEGYYLNWNKSMSGNIEIFDSYLVNITNNIEKHLGGNK